MPLCFEQVAVNEVVCLVLWRGNQFSVSVPPLKFVARALAAIRADERVGCAILEIAALIC